MGVEGLIVIREKKVLCRRGGLLGRRGGGMGIE